MSKTPYYSCIISLLNNEMKKMHITSHTHSTFIYIYIHTHTFLARETGGGGNEQETRGEVPSSTVHSSTPKHLQLLRRDFFLPFLSDGLYPPTRGITPGVLPAGVEHPDGIIISSLILPISPNTLQSRFRHA